MATSGDVNITILDNAGTVVVPGSNVQVVIGCCSGGVTNQVYATTNPNTLVNTSGYGPAVEAAAITCAAGGVVIFIKVATATAGLVTGSTVSTIAVTGASTTSPIVITTASNTLATGQVVTLAAVGGQTGANGTFVITVLSPTTFSLNGSTSVSSWTSGGTVQPKGQSFFGTGTSIITVTGTPYDDNYIKFLCTTGGTIGSAGIQFQISLDAGRNYGPVLALGTANTYAIPNTGVTLNFAAGTLVALDYLTFSTTAPTWNTAGLAAALTALQASQYAVVGFGSTHIVGVMSGANSGTVETDLDTLATGDIYTRCIVEARDASPPIQWGGTAETETTWMAAIETDYSAVGAKRICSNGGYYNTQSPIPNSAAGTPAYRRPLAWALAARQVTIPPQRHAGRVKDGALSQIIVDPTNDPKDGFIYHDERLNPGLDAARFSSATTRIGKPGFFIKNPNLMSPLGSDFTILPLGLVMDVTCSIVHQTGEEEINDDLRLNPNGTLYKNDALALQTTIGSEINSQQLATSEISGYAVVVDQTNNVLQTETVNIAVTIESRGYVLQENVTIAYGQLST
jgi:Protein of unknown function (DUF2586)/Ubiquitin-activating enzyme E1 FCCH domain